MIQYRVTKPGLMSTGWVGKYVAHFNSDFIILEFPNGRELKYMKTSVEKVTEKEEHPGLWIVVKESGKERRPQQYKHHESEESARKEAIRLAQKCPGEGFRYYRQCGRVEYKAITSYELKETR